MTVFTEINEVARVYFCLTNSSTDKSRFKLYLTIGEVGGSSWVSWLDLLNPLFVNLIRFDEQRNTSVSSYGGATGRNLPGRGVFATLPFAVPADFQYTVQHVLECLIIANTKRYSLTPMFNFSQEKNRIEVQHPGLHIQIYINIIRTIST